MGLEEKNNVFHLVPGTQWRMVQKITKYHFFPLISFPHWELFKGMELCRYIQWTAFNCVSRQEEKGKRKADSSYKSERSPWGFRRLLWKERARTLCSYRQCCYSFRKGYKVFNLGKLWQLLAPMTEFLPLVEKNNMVLWGISTLSYQSSVLS